MMNNKLIRNFTAQATQLYSSTTLKVLARILSKTSQNNAQVQEQLADFNNGAKILFKINYLKNAFVAFQVRDKHLYLIHEREQALIDYDLAIVIKHPALAFKILSLQEGNTIAVANNRFSTNGDASLAINFINCLEIVEAHLLPRFISRRILSKHDDISINQKINFLKRIIM